MVIGIEGNVHVGKTTYIKQNLNSYQRVSEIEFKEDLSDYERQLFYISEEKKRKIKNSNYENLVIDRTLISTSIYSLNSNIFTKSETEKLRNILNECVIKKDILIPDYIYLINYPFDLINNNHSKEGEKKHTQDLLVDYKYYLKYSLFFSQFTEQLKEIDIIGDFRQVIKFSGKYIFQKVTDDIPVHPKVLLDGAPAIGKTTILKKQEIYTPIKEFSYKKYSLEDYNCQLESIIDRIKILSQDNIMADTSFLMGITHLFYNQKMSKEQKLEVINKIISKVPMCLYITKIIYLSLDVDKLRKRKENDIAKPRLHFEDNLKYLKEEINFYKALDKGLGFKSNIMFLDANQPIGSLIKQIEHYDSKPLLLIDLFYCLYDLIKLDEI